MPYSERGPIVAKFGGTSLATGERVEEVVKIIKSDPRRLYIIPSAPGTTPEGGLKVTNLLYLCHEMKSQHLPLDEPFGKISDRYLEIANRFKLQQEMAVWLEELLRGIKGNWSVDEVASRGEFYMAKTLAAILGADFFDAADLIVVDKNRRVDDKTYGKIGRKLPYSRSVIPGFYGATESGEIKTLPRGGSDVTGAAVAKGVGAELYENWTDVGGVKPIDPRVEKKAPTLEEITYDEMREMSNGGAGVLHADSVLPAYKAKIPIEIKDTFHPNNPGTRIVYEREVPLEQAVIAIVGDKDFVSIRFKQFGLNEEPGIGMRVFNVFGNNGVSYLHNQSTVDSITVVVKKDQMDGKLSQIIRDLNELNPDKLAVKDNLAIINVVGEGMGRHYNAVASALVKALEANGIDLELQMFTPGSISATIGVKNEALEPALRALYAACIDS